MTAYAQYTAQALRRYPFGEYQQKATQVDNGGDVIQIADGRIAIVETLGGGNEAIAVNDPETLYTTGVFEIASASATVLAQGVPAYWDPVAAQIIGTGGGTHGAVYAGLVVKAKVSGATTVYVDINAAVPGQGMPLAVISASQTSGQANATKLLAKTNIVETSAAGGYVALPPPFFGETCKIMNPSGQTITVYPNAAEGLLIGAAGSASSYAVTTGKSVTFEFDGTNWYAPAAA